MLTATMNVTKKRSIAMTLAVLMVAAMPAFNGVCSADASLWPHPPNVGMAPATRKRKADGKDSTRFMGSVSL